MQHCWSPGHLWGEGRRMKEEWLVSGKQRSPLTSPPQSLCFAGSYFSFPIQKHLNGSWPWTPQTNSIKAGESLGSRKRQTEVKVVPCCEDWWLRGSTPTEESGRETFCTVSGVSWLSEEWPGKLCRAFPRREVPHTLGRSLCFSDPASQVFSRLSRVGKACRVGSFCIPNKTVIN